MTVEAVLDAVERVLRKEGPDAITTNRIAEAAGVSIGSVYQYFPDKQSIFTALHQRHVEEVREVIEQAIAAHGSAPVEDFLCALVQGLMDAHDADPRLHEIVANAVPESTLGFRRALLEAFERVLPASPRRVVLAHLVEALVHGGVAQRALDTPLADLKREAVQAVRAYVSAEKR